jgi:hypothetical protein
VAVASSRRRIASIVAIAAVACAYAVVLPLPDSNQNAHYALVKSLANGTARIDETRREVGDLGTWDISRMGGHVYSNKAPGLAFVAIPVYATLSAAGMRTTGDPIRMLWALHLAAVVLPAFVLLLLVASLGDRLEPGLGAAAAVSVGLGSLLLPYGTMLFAHVLSAMLGFAAFALLWRERDGPPHVGLVAAAGVLAGLAVVVEYPLAVIAAILGAYAVSRRGVLRRGFAYTAGVAVGVAPLLIYDTLAFGSPMRISQTGALYGGHELHHGFFGLGTPRVSVAVDLLLWGNRSLLVPAPILVAGAIGTIVLYRRGRRAEALVIGVVALAAPVYISGHVGPFGDVGAGPRYLIAAVPFLAVPLALAYRRFPTTTVALAAISIAWMVAVTLTHPQASWDGHVLDRLTSPRFGSYTQTATELVGVSGPTRLLPFVLAVLVAVVGASVAAGPRLPGWRGLATAAVAVGGWIVVLAGAPRLVRSGLNPTLSHSLALGLGLASVGAVVLFDRRTRRARTPTPTEALQTPLTN